jgi:hypothetical protein
MAASYKKVYTVFRSTALAAEAGNGRAAIIRGIERTDGLYSRLYKQYVACGAIAEGPERVFSEQIRSDFRGFSRHMIPLMKCNTLDCVRRNGRPFERDVRAAATRFERLLAATRIEDGPPSVRKLTTRMRQQYGAYGALAHAAAIGDVERYNAQLDTTNALYAEFMREIRECG